ncbi:MAG: hypothetical protein CSB15_00730 [Clostridiales bacterium]|nr:MAG: hypothetical protein CSB15_00730 [Clostridiales bacterium]
MEKDVVIINFNVAKKNINVDLEVSLNISANELVIALNKAYNLGINTEDIKSCYLKSERPISLLKGNKPLSYFGVRNGTVINYTE